MRPGEVGAGEVDVIHAPHHREVGSDGRDESEIGVVEAGVEEPRIEEVGLAKLGVRKIGKSKVVETGQRGVDQYSFLEVRLFAVDPGQDCARENGFIKHGSGHLGIAQIRTGHFREPEIGAFEICV